MKKRTRILASFILMLTMIFQTVNVLAEGLVITSTQMGSRPAQELDYQKLYSASGEAKIGCFEKIPILYNNAPVNEITLKLNKQYDNGGRKYKLEGETSVKIEAYAYKTGNSVKLAVLYGYYGYAGHPGDPGDPGENNVIWVQGFYEQNGQDDSPINSIDNEIWNNGSFENNQAKLDKCKEIIRNNNYSVKLNSIKFKEESNQERKLSWDATALKGNNTITACTSHDSNPPAFITFQSAKGIKITRTVTSVEGQKNQWDVQVQIKNPVTGGGKAPNNLSNVEFNDKLAAQFKVISSEANIKDNNTAIAWNIGQLNEGIDKTLTYRIQMVEGTLGRNYPISDYAEMKYTLSGSTVQYIKSTSNDEINNPKVSANWAKINVKHFDEKDIWLNTIHFNDFEAWVKVPVNFQEGQVINISPYSTMNALNEIDGAVDSVYIADKNKPATHKFIGMKKNDNTYDTNLILALSTISTDMPLYYSLIGSNIRTELELLSSGKTIDKYATIINDSNKTPERILAAPVVVAKNSIIAVDVQGENLKKQEYRLIKGTKPTLPISDTTGWNTLGALNGVKYNLKENYPDFINTSGYISTRHYNYKYGDKTPTTNIPSRANTFNYGIGENLVIQKANASEDNQYYSTRNNSAFFDGSLTGMTKVELDFVPSQSGAYTFAVYTNGGAKGTITINGQQKMFLNTAHSRVNAPRYIRVDGTDQVYNLEAGKKYHMSLEWEHYNALDPAPCLYYQIGGTAIENNWKVIPKESLVNESYIGGANKAVKFWGYLAPQITEAGKFNLGSLSDDGVYGYIVIDNQKVEFAEDWRVAPPNLRTGKTSDGNKRVSLNLEPGKVYPIYMEWYEGCPMHKAFLPKYTTDGGSNWKTIPEDWFYPSSDPTPGEVDEAYFVPNTVSQIALGEEAGVYYTVIKLTDNTGKEYQQLYGPIEMKDTIPVDAVEKDKNMLVPESISNFWWNTNFNSKFKNVKYEIDMNDIINKKFIEGSSEVLFKFDLSKAYVKVKQGTTVVDPTNYTLTNNNNKFTVIFKPEYITNATDTYQIDIYVPTKMGKTVVYNGTNSYLQKYLGTTLEAKLKVYGSEEYMLQTVKEDGSIVTTVDYRVDAIGNVPEIASTKLNIKCKEMPRIN